MPSMHCIAMFYIFYYQIYHYFDLFYPFFLSARIPIPLSQTLILLSSMQWYWLNPLLSRLKPIIRFSGYHTDVGSYSIFLSIWLRTMFDKGYKSVLRMSSGRIMGFPALPQRFPRQIVKIGFAQLKKKHVYSILTLI